MSVPKEYKMVIENEILIQKISVLSDFKTKFLQRVRFQITFFTTRQILKQKFQNMSDFNSKNLQRVRFCFKKFFFNQISNKNLHSKNHFLTEFTP